MPDDSCKILWWSHRDEKNVHMSRTKWIREKWPKEAEDFTPWLKENLELVSNCTGFELRQLGKEVPAAGGRADIVAWETKSKTKVVIENQIGSANARHFQQLVAYGESLEARIRIWVASSFSDKFRRLASEENKKGESNPKGSIYYFLRICYSKEAEKQTILSLDLAPNQAQIEKVMLTETKRESREMLKEEFWGQWRRRPVRTFNIDKYNRAHIVKTLAIDEAKIMCFVWCYKGFRRKDNIRSINYYSKRLSVVFPQTYINPVWRYDEVRRDLLEVKRYFDLEDLDSWEEIQEWFLDVERKIINCGQ